MLSFLREQNVGNLPQQESAGDADSAPDKGSEKSHEQEYLTVATHGRRARKSTMLLAILFIVGLLCLWFMIKKSTPQSASAAAINTEETQIETAIARLTGIKSEIFSRMDEIVNKFYEFSEVLQVQVNELAKNPFELEVFLANLKRKPDEKIPEIDPETIRQQQIRQKSRQMQLVSIMQSEQGTCCMIDNKILYEGDLIRDFRVHQIGGNYVRLGWNPKGDDMQSQAQSDDVEIILKLSE